MNTDSHLSGSTNPEPSHTITAEEGKEDIVGGRKIK